MDGQLPDGSFTEWQSFPLEITAHDSSFSEECPCTSYEAKPLRVVVPEAARIDPAAPMRGEGGDGPN